MCEHKDATEFTRKINEAVLGELPFGYTNDFEDAARGFIAPLCNGSQNHSLDRTDENADATVTLSANTSTQS